MAKSLKNKRKFERISFKERVIIENRYCVDKKRVKDIAIELGRSWSSVTREIGGRSRIGRGKYSADARQREVEESRGNQGRKSKFDYEPLKNYVIAKMKQEDWSPEQIEIRLPIDYPKDKKMRVSYEAIYQYIYSQIYRNGNGKVKPDCEDLRAYLPRRHKRRAQKGFRKAQKLERIGILPSIEDRPKEAEKRKTVGHWEGDTLVSRKSDSKVKSLNERKSGVVFFGKTKNGTARECDLVTVNRLEAIPSPYRKTLTQDRGTENFEYQHLEKELNICCFFAHPYSSYERGSNENVNGLFRRYFPKGTDFDTISDKEIERVEYLINTRPRKRFNGLNPFEMFYKLTGVALDS